MTVYDLNASYDSVSRAFVMEAAKTLRSALQRIEHCVKQLPEGDLWHRPQTGMNAVGNILLHLEGNLTQWVVDAIPDAPNKRNRPAEFAARGGIGKAELLGRLQTVVARAEHAIAGVSEAELLAARKIQGFDTTVLAAVFHGVSHFEGHAQEIVYITRLRLGEKYVFQWTPPGQ